MKKQLLIAAVAATMTSVAMADISISGAAQVNYTTTDYDAAGTADTNTISHDFDLKVTGKSGATTVVMDIENTDAGAELADAAINTNSQEMNVKNAYMATSIAGVNVKMGTWYGSDTLLSNGSQTEDQVSLDTTISGVKVQYEDNMSTSSVTLSGSVAGVKLSHEIFDTKTDTSVSGSFGGVNVAYRDVDADSDAADSKTSLEVSTEFQGVTATYANVDAGTSGTSSDTFFGTVAAADMMEADGFGVKTSMAGNTVNLKSYTLKNTSSVDQDYTKLVVTRALASGATLEGTYTDKNSVSTALDLELRVKF
jgi:hypothetical protein